jgi:hypothetical protein
MKRGVATVLGGLLAWFVFATAVNFIFRAAISGYHAAELTLHFMLGMKVARLALGAGASICAGYTAASIAKSVDLATKLLGLLLTAMFIPIHYGLWDKFPVWYHVIFLGSLFPVTLLGARLRTKLFSPMSSAGA